MHKNDELDIPFSWADIKAVYKAKCVVFNFSLDASAEQEREQELEPTCVSSYGLRYSLDLLQLL